MRIHLHLITSVLPVDLVRSKSNIVLLLFTSRRILNILKDHDLSETKSLIIISTAFCTLAKVKFSRHSLQLFLFKPMPNRLKAIVQRKREAATCRATPKSHRRGAVNFHDREAIMAFISTSRSDMTWLRLAICLSRSAISASFLSPSL